MSVGLQHTVLVRIFKAIRQDSKDNFHLPFRMFSSHLSVTLSVNSSYIKNKSISIKKLNF